MRVRGTYVTGKILLLSQDDLVRVQLSFKLGDELLDALFVGG
jgi:hypothetical protein